MFARLRNDLKDESGAVLIIVASAMLFLLGIAAIAVDLSALRSDIRTDSMVADSAVTAGVASINPFSGDDAEVGCQVAWEYVLLNLEDEGGSPVAPNCAALAAACTASSTAISGMKNGVCVLTMWLIAGYAAIGCGPPATRCWRTIESRSRSVACTEGVVKCPPSAVMRFSTHMHCSASAISCTTASNRRSVDRLASENA